MASTDARGGTDADPREAFRALPSVDEALRRPALAELGEGRDRDFMLRLVRERIEAWRREILDGQLDAAGVVEGLAAGRLEAEVIDALRREDSKGIQRVINATGVVLHTGLGRAPVHSEVAQAMARAAGGYCLLEVDRASGQRNQRDARLGELLARLTGAEDGICVNNNAAAVLITLQTFARGGEAVVSRGELVEIGGSFRVPDVMTRAGVQLVEVGTTNRTRIADYRAAVNERTGILLKVHRSNFRVVGFTEETGGDEIGALGRELGVATANDLGSGLLELAGARPLDMLGGEPLVKQAVADGVDVVMFSGDKLLGGPQAGLIVGKRKVVQQIRKNPTYRAMRCDKATIAGLEKTLELYLAGRADEIPSRAMMLASAEELRPRADGLANQLADIEGLDVQVVADRSQPGSGSAPDVYLDTYVVSLAAKKLSTTAFASALRDGDPCVFARIQDDRLLFDPRTLLPGEDDELTAAIRAAL
ncbi:MAG: L-seryl-tRNA(Sec) selenium transferase [Planctomycetes bacterium]|nr:L-seryl-tRNA(Sec) selenium transferase [Planctomycetota bacterium]MCB9904844.1 L-seryl-tRNA(Sec) selenium transferase [Planctomycetota bacterium]